VLDIITLSLAGVATDGALGGDDDERVRDRPAANSLRRVAGEGQVYSPAALAFEHHLVRQLNPTGFSRWRDLVLSADPRAGGDRGRS
jgi:hypothetical protein